MNRNGALALFLIGLAAFCAVFTEPARAPADAVADSWTAKTLMLEARAHLGVAVVYGKLYAIGGDAGSETGSGMTGDGFSGQVTGTTEEYDPATELWNYKAPMPTARALFGIAVYQNKVYCIGGYYAIFTYKGEDLDEIEYFNTGANEVYDPTTDTWET
jgi:hypothetical protein